MHRYIQCHDIQLFTVYAMLDKQSIPVHWKIPLGQNVKAMHHKEQDLSRPLYCCAIH